MCEYGWMTCDFTFFSTVFQSYQDDGRMIIKCSVQWNPMCVGTRAYGGYTYISEAMVYNVVISQ